MAATPLVNLIIWGHLENISWQPGQAITVSSASVEKLYEAIQQQLDNSSCSAILFWDAQLGQPDETYIKDLLDKRADIFHAGLQLGVADLPKILNFVQPIAMLNRDIDSNVGGSSWRLSFSACLIRAQVFQEIGNIDPNFATLEACALEFGYRCINSGVIVRFEPQLVMAPVANFPQSLPVLDEFRFIQKFFGRKFQLWAIWRALITGYWSMLQAFKAFRHLFSSVQPTQLIPYAPNQIDLSTIQLPNNVYQVTVLLITLERYPYLYTVLDQLREQTIAPFEILVIDQTPIPKRDTEIATKFADLPLQVIYQEVMGQCSSRNRGLNIAKGEYILFIDDDDEIPPDLIENHLKNLEYFQAEVSCGKVDEVGALPLTGKFYTRMLVAFFPTNNTLIRKDILAQSGLFDLAFEQRQSEDADLGMRIYLSGALMIYNPAIQVLHHRATSGGLRQHGARVMTYSSSRTKLTHRRFAHISEIYIMKRYYKPQQIREQRWLSILGTFSIRGAVWRKIFKILVALILLPNTLYQLRQREKDAESLLQKYPDIPQLESTSEL